MSAQKGKAVLVKMGDGGDPETFTLVAGLKSKSISLKAGEVDATDSDSPGGWRELLDGAGVLSAAVSGSGVFRSGAAAEAVRAAFFAHQARRFELQVPGLGVLSGPFQITNLDYAGQFDGEATYTLALASAGPVAFAAS